tara:strand:- start:974 stop:1219 length:246 start_codon:yes stop_codon:yes gene_type:complete
LTPSIQVWLSGLKRGVILFLVARMTKAGNHFYLQEEEEALLSPLAELVSPIQSQKLELNRPLIVPPAAIIDCQINVSFQGG